jgi:uncharacterized damage-inducible protein DinB
MSFNQSFIEELKQEAANTRKMLEVIPVDKNDWRPHAKSMSLGRLATHVAEIAHWITDIMSADELDFATAKFSGHTASSNAELLAILDENVNKAVKALENSKDEDFGKLWTMRSGDKVFYSLPKGTVIRRFGYSHLYHHRGQLSVYLRLLDVPVPGMYGPTADERAMTTANA